MNVAVLQAYLAERCDRVAVLDQGKLSHITAREGGRWRPTEGMEKQLALATDRLDEQPPDATESLAEEELETDEALPIRRSSVSLHSCWVVS